MDRQRLADALAYEQERRRRLASVVPMPASGQPETASTPSLRSNLENLSIGLGEGLTNQLEGVRALVTDPIGTAKGTYEAVRGVVRDPSVIAQALREMGSRAASGPLGAGEVVGEMLGPMRGRPAPDMLELDVYHGTPHRFPATEANPLGEFDASKIGTGEGAQAYGHGVYLAENPEIARGYQKDLSNYTQPFIQFKGQKIAGTSLSDLDITAYKYLQTGKKDAGQFPHNTVYYAKKAVENAPDKYWTEKFSKEEILKRINEFGSDVKFGEEKNLGALYKADLPDEMIDRMLDYDKPMSQQPEAVKKILMQDKRLKSLYERGKIDDFYDNAGHFYRTVMAEQRQNAPINLSEEAAEKWAEPFASERLRQMGIPGIKYLDAGSRGKAGTGTRNFVVFPGEEKKVRILERK